MKTTLNQVRRHSPCSEGWSKLLAHLGKTKADDEPLAITTILDSNGLEDALWCLRAIERHDREIRLFAVWCARQVQHLMTDQRSVAALDTAERYAAGLASDSELKEARSAAWSAVRTAEATEAAWSAEAEAAAWSTAWSTAAEAAVEAAAEAAAAWSTAAAGGAKNVRDYQEAQLRLICSRTDTET